MIKWLKVIFAVLGIGAIGFVALAYFVLSHYFGNELESQWRQKMTISVETPDGIKSGSSVVQIDVEIGNRELSRKTAGSGVGWKVRGEAVVVDLGGGRYLFALLKGAGGYQSAPGRNALFAFADMKKYDPGKDILPVADVAATKRNVPVELPAKSWPLFVTFADINDPKTVKRVDMDDLDAAFGAGYALKSITLEITDEPVTKGVVEGVINWLSQYPEPGLCKATGRSSNIPFCRRVHHGDLIRR